MTSAFLHLHIRALILTTVYLLACFIPGSAQFNNLESITTQQGLSQGMIFDIYQTEDGFLWFGTKNGLNRYDGYEFKIFNHDPYDSTSISGSGVTAIFEDSRGLLWVGTTDSGLNIFDRNNNLFCKVTSNDSIQLNSIWEINETSNGTIILGAYPCNIVKIPSSLIDLEKVKNQTRISFDGLEQVTSIESITEESMLYHDLAIHITQDNKIMVGLRNGLFELNEVTMQLTKVDLPKNDFYEEVLSITENEDGVLFVARREEVLSQKDGRWKSCKLEMGDSDGEGLKIRSVFVWKDKLIASGHNLNFEINIKTLETSLIENLEGKTITKILRDDSGNLWFGTNGIGLLKYSEFKNGIEGHFLDRSIWDFYPHNDSLIWMELEKEALLFNHVDKSIEYSSPNLSYTRDMIQDKKGNSWLLKRETGGGISLYKLDEKYNLKNKIPLLCKSNLKSSLVLDGQNIIVSGTECELSQFNISDNEEIVYSYRELLGVDSLNVVSNYIIKSRVDNKFWIALNKGLVSCQIENGILNCEKHHQAYIHHLLEDFDEPHKYIWAGTKNRGLLKIDKSTGEFISYSKRSGLLDNEVYAIAYDSAHNSIWLSTNRGISQMNRKTNEISNFSTEDGFQGPEFNSGAVHVDKEGYLYFGSVNGFSRFDPSEIWTTDYSPKTVITHLEINGKIKDALLQDQFVELNYDENVITFHFASLDFTSPKKNTYKYRIKGLNNKWTEISNNRSTTFGQLSPGNYTFQVIGSNRSMVYSGDYTSFSFRINPPFWRTNFAYLFYGVILLTSIYYLFRVRMKKYQVEKELEFNIREAKRLEQIEQMKSSFFSNITHELRTPLTLIIEPIRQILNDNVDGNIRKKLNLAGKSSMKLLNLVNNLLDIAKIESKVMKPVWSVGNIEEHILQIIDSYQVLVDKKEIKVKYNYNIKKNQITYDLAYFEKIFTNVFGNAIKYTEIGSIDVFCTKISENGMDFLEIKVKDTGIGIAEEEIDIVFDRFQRLETNNTYGGTGIGLALAKELVELMQGTILISSKKYEGTQVTIRFPWKESEVERVDRSNLVMSNYHTYFDTEKMNLIPSSKKLETPLILIVEDNDELRDFLSSSLQDEYSIIEARDGVEGTEKALEIIPDIIISDIKMPRMEGIEMCAKLKSNNVTSHIPVILLTAKSSLDSRLEGVDIGADVYLTKPFSIKEVRSYIQNQLLKRKVLWKYFESNKSSKIEKPNQLQSIEEAFIDKVKHIIDIHLSNEDLDVNLILKEAAVSRTHLHRKLKALTGQSTTEFIRNQRLDRALELLIANQGTDISQIAYTVGFNNQSYFSTKFKDKFGYPPSQVSKSNR